MSPVIRILSAGEEAVLATCAPDVFDDPINPEAAKQFLADPRHHLAVATEDGTVVGFASAVHYVHPDKQSPELWINEVGVASRYRRQEIGKRLLQALLKVAQKLGCSEAWVLTDRANEPAMRLYSSTGGEPSPDDEVMFTFHVRDH